MKKFKRNAVIVTVLIFAAAAIYLNWSYGRETDRAAVAGDSVTSGEQDDRPVPSETAAHSEDPVEAGDAGLFFEGEPEETSTKQQEYFAEVRLERQAARDEAAAALETVAASEDASQETVDGALAAMTQMAKWAAKETELENLIRAKGFDDCVVYLSDSGATVTVASGEGLSEAAVARITDVIVSGTEFSAGELNVIEIK